MRIATCSAAAAAVLMLAFASVGSAQCPPCNTCIGDCPPIAGVQLNDPYLVAEVVKGTADISSCPKADGACDGTVNVSDLVQASRNYENGNCNAGLPGTTTNGATVALDAEATCINANGSLNFFVRNDSGVVNASAAQGRILWPSVVDNVDCVMPAALAAAGWYNSTYFDAGTGEWSHVIFNADGVRTLAAPSAQTTVLECAYHVKSGTPKAVYQVTVSGGVVSNANGQAMATISNPGHINVNCP